MPLKRRQRKFMAKKTDEAHTPVGLTCGLVMPISPIDGCSAEHWMEVKSIISDAVGSIENFKFSTRLVSDQDDVGVIQKRIVQNIFDSDIVICDVSCKNANVMFELGMRLAFDKPTILIKDDMTDFSFDTGVIEHLVYPRDLRFSRIVAFKSALADKVVATYKAATTDPNFSTFLKHFGSFKVATIDQAVYTPDEALLTMMQELSQEVGIIRKRLSSFSMSGPTPPPPPPRFSYRIHLNGGLESLDPFVEYLKKTMRSVVVREIVILDPTTGDKIKRAIELSSSTPLEASSIIDAATRYGIEATVTSN